MSLHLFIASHGEVAKSALATAEMIIGVKQEHVDTICVLEGRSYDECLEELQKKYEAIKEDVDGVVILTDIYGGTPANIASYLALSTPRVQVFSGCSIPILLEYLLTQPQSLEEAVETIESAGSQAVINISQKLEEVKDNANSIDTY